MFHFQKMSLFVISHNVLKLNCFRYYLHAQCLLYLWHRLNYAIRFEISAMHFSRHSSHHLDIVCLQVHRYGPESDCDAVSEHVAICFDRLISNIYRLFCALGDKCLFVLTSSRTTFYQTRVLSMPSLVTNWLSMKHFSDKFLYHTTKLQNYVCVGANCSTRELCFYKLLWLIFLFPQMSYWVKFFLKVTSQ